MRAGPLPLRQAAGIGAALVLLGAAAGSTLPRTMPAAEVVMPASLSQRLSPRTWALAIPIPWLSAPIRDLRAGDVIDLLGARSGAAGADYVALGLRVVSVDDATIVVELTPEDAAEIASARARGLSLVPILRAPQ